MQTPSGMSETSMKRVISDDMSDNTDFKRLSNGDSSVRSDMSDTQMVRVNNDTSSQGTAPINKRQHTSQSKYSDNSFNVVRQEDKDFDEDEEYDEVKDKDFSGQRPGSTI